MRSVSAKYKRAFKEAEAAFYAVFAEAEDRAESEAYWLGVRAVYRVLKANAPVGWTAHDDEIVRRAIAKRAGEAVASFICGNDP